MEKLKLCMVLLFLGLAVISCRSAPSSETAVPETAAPEPVAVEVLPPVPEKAFDPANISQEVFNSTKIDVQHFIGDLNKIIHSKDFNAWRAVLAPSYFAAISSPEFLKDTSELPRLKTRNIVLKTPQDYFINVVVPSRANDHVEDIEFISENKVKAFTINEKGQRLRLYELEHTGNNWLIKD
jgi:hypothetical protein